MALRLWRDDRAFLVQLGRFQRALARVVSVALIAVILVATAQLLLGIGAHLVPGQLPLIGTELNSVLGDVLTLLIAVEVLENVASYLREEGLQLQLVLVTAITAVARKIIVLPSDTSNGPLYLAGLAVATLFLCAAYWLVEDQAQRRRAPGPGSRGSLKETPPRD
ncbi:MAG: phosphate-starvation-inducible PsiE family protein [Synechococcus sp.]